VLETRAERVKSGGRPTPQESEDRLARVLEIAQQHFLKFGYSDTSLEGIAREAGVAKKTLYHRYGSKDGLFTTIFQTLGRTWATELSDIVVGSGQPDLVLEAVALRLLDVGTSPDMIGLYRLVLVEAHRFFESIREPYSRGNGSPSMEPLENYLRAAVSDGTLRIDDVVLAAEQFAHLVLSGIRTLLLLGVVRPPQAERSRIARQAVDIFLRGCAVERKSHASGLKVRNAGKQNRRGERCGIV
jgi:AcrR family transcriptional regulator